MGKRLWDLAKSRFEIGTFLLAHRHKVPPPEAVARQATHAERERDKTRRACANDARRADGSTLKGYNYFQ